MTPAERLIWFRHANVGRSRALWEEGVDAMLGAPGIKRKRPARERGGGGGRGGDAGGGAAPAGVCSRSSGRMGAEVHQGFRSDTLRAGGA